MSISFTKYVAITSGVGAGSNVRQRDLILRLFTNNLMVPPQSVLEFTSAADVATYFGSTSAEYLRALVYFSFISKNITSPTKISFGRWVDTAVAPRIYGAVGPQSLGSWTSITAGAFGLTIGGVINTFTGINFSSAGSLAAVAALLQTTIRAAANTSAQWTGAIVTYDATAQRFNFVGGSTGAATISVQAGAGAADITGQLGWASATTIIAPGSAVETLTDSLNTSVGVTNNFGSFTYIPTLTTTQVLEVATWNNSQNVYFMYLPGFAVYADGQTFYANMATLGGWGATYSPLSTEYPELAPAMIGASIDYTRRNSVQNFMYQNGFTFTPSVKDNTTSNNMDAIRGNYYGQTQTAGQFLSFYQRGIMGGGPANPVDMNVYFNEMWLKDAAGSAIMTLFLSLGKVSANAQGRSQFISTLQPVVQQALFNGTISVGKALTSAQKLYIGQITGDDLSWQQVQNIGYWLDAVIVPYVNGQTNLTEYKIVYTLIYSKDDDVRKVEGSHILI